MNLRQIQELIKFVAKSGATEVDIEIGDVKLSIKSPPKGKINNNDASLVAQLPPVQAPPVQAPPVQAPPVQAAPVQAAPVQAPPVEIPRNELKSEASQEAVSDNELGQESEYITIKAPIIGTFYRRPSPDKEAFINVGDKIQEGSILCIIEAMKLFNEIESELKGTVVKVLVEDMSPVEYDQPLFLIDPS